MKLSLSEDQTILRDSLRRFAERQIPAAISSPDSAAEILTRLRPALAQLGVWDLAADPLTAALVAEEIAHSEPSTAILVALHLGLLAPSLTSSSTSLSLSDGSTRVALAIDDFVIAPADGVDALLLVRNQPAASLHLLQPPSLTLRPGLGLDGLRTGLLTTTEDHSSRPIDVTPAQLHARLGTTSTLLAAAAIGTGRAALNQALEYAAEREQFARPLNRFQAIQFKLADMATALDSARWLLWRAAATNNAELADLALIEATAAANFTADESLQIHGGYGYTREYPVESLFRHAQEIRRIATRWLSFTSSSQGP